jgi:hypothetical protein
MVTDVMMTGVETQWNYIMIVIKMYVYHKEGQEALMRKIEL